VEVIKTDRNGIWIISQSCYKTWYSNKHKTWQQAPFISIHKTTSYATLRFKKCSYKFIIQNFRTKLTNNPLTNILNSEHVHLPWCMHNKTVDKIKPVMIVHFWSQQLLKNSENSILANTFIIKKLQLHVVNDSIIATFHSLLTFADKNNEQSSYSTATAPNSNVKSAILYIFFHNCTSDLLNVAHVNQTVRRQWQLEEKHRN